MRPGDTHWSLKTVIRLKICTETGAEGWKYALRRQARSVAVTREINRLNGVKRGKDVWDTRDSEILMYSILF